MIKKLQTAIGLFLHPQSPAAVYRNPRCLFNNVLARLLNAYLKLAEALRPENKVACTICGWSGNTFGYSAAVSVDQFDSNDICLNCSSNQRTRMLMDLFVQHAPWTDPITVADVGASRSTRTFFARYPHIQYLVVDRYKDADIDSDITHIQLSNNAVDYILCCHVLEHIDNYKKGIEELFRILKPGHGGIIAVPQTSGLAASKRTNTGTYKGYGHIWEFGDDFAAQLATAGFQVNTVHVSATDGNKPLKTIPYHLVFKP